MGWDGHSIVCNMLQFYENCYKILVEKMKGPTYEAWGTAQGTAVKELCIIIRLIELFKFLEEMFCKM
jgi:hypothetical protein